MSVSVWGLPSPGLGRLLSVARLSRCCPLVETAQKSGERISPLPVMIRRLPALELCESAADDPAADAIARVASGLSAVVLLGVNDDRLAGK